MISAQCCKLCKLLHLCLCCCSAEANDFKLSAAILFGLNHQPSPAAAPSTTRDTDNEATTTHRERLYNYGIEEDAEEMMDGIRLASKMKHEQQVNTSTSGEGRKHFIKQKATTRLG